MFDLATKKILVTGGNGFIGRFVVANLKETRRLTADQIIIPDATTDDLRNIDNCRRLLRDHQIDAIIHLAALIGGVGYSSKFPATQYYNNILMDLNVVEAAREHRVKKILLVSSSCSYPRDAAYPLTEDQLWNGLPQETNLAYGIAKRILTVQAKAYREEYGLNVQVVIPNNAYGPGDNFHEEYSHVIPSLIRKSLKGESPLVVWGDGTPTRDFLYVKDFAEGVVLALENLESGEPINLGTGTEISIRELAELIQKLTNHKGEIVYDTTKPNGQPRRSVNTNRAHDLLGFTPKYTLEQGLAETITWFKNQDQPS